MTTKVLWVLNVIALLGLTKAAEWSYKGDKGPPQWKDTFPKCGGQSQSPIDIGADSTLTYDGGLGQFNFTGYNSMTALTPTLKNNGHSVQLDINATSVGNTYMTGGGLPGKYIALQLHFHWGSDNDNGSEHTFRGHQFPLELHIVHVKDSLTVDAAKNVSDGLAVLGIFFVLDPNGENNTAIHPLIQALSNIRYKDQTHPLSLDFAHLMPAIKTEFYRYMGSLTTPGCDEAVVWTVFENKNTISEAQMREFRALYETNVSETTHAEKLEMNFRPVQPLNSRTVKKNFNKAVPDSFHWGYHGYEGPENWKLYYEECGKEAQSPIDIPDVQTSDMVFDSSINLDTLTFTNYDKAFTGNISNNGHAIQVDIAPSAGLAITNGGLGGTFRAAQFHFHWGPNDHHGSEHTIKGHSYSMEIHIVHYNDKYVGVAEAATQPDGLAVVGFFIEALPAINAQYSSIVSALGDVKYKNSPKKEVSNLNMRDLTNKDLRLNDTTGKHLPFFRYKGSLTTPGCMETVTWTVMESTIKMGESQIAAFREMTHITSGSITEKDKISENYRPVLPLNTRKVYMSHNMKTSRASGASSVLAVIVMPIVAQWFYMS